MLARGEAPKSMNGASFSSPTAAGVRVAVTTSTMYFWIGGSSASQFGLRGGAFVEIEALALKPSMWNGGHEHQGAGLMFVLAGARESRAPSACLFPEIMKAEFHGIRSVIEAYSRSASIEGIEQPHAAGVMLTKGDNSWNATVRVWASGRSLDYRLDRWD